MKTFVDSNVFIRLFTCDDAGQQAKSEELFRWAERGTLKLVTGPPVFFETAWVLKHSYKCDKQDILDALETLLHMEGLTVLDDKLVADAIQLARATNSDFADSYIAASASKVHADNVATFNKKHFENLGVEQYNFDSER